MCPADGPMSQGTRATRKGQYLSLQAGGIQDSDLGPAASPHGVLQAQQGADGPWPHCQAHGRALQVPGNISWRERKEAGQGPGLLNPREPWPAAVGPAWLHKTLWPISVAPPPPPSRMAPVCRCLHLCPPTGAGTPQVSFPPPFSSLPLSLSLLSIRYTHTHTPAFSQIHLPT